jgi:hypothetical protein
LSSVALLARRDVFRGAGRDDMAAGVAAFGAEIGSPCSAKGTEACEIRLDRVEFVEEPPEIGMRISDSVQQVGPNVHRLGIAHHMVWNRDQLRLYTPHPRVSRD